MEHVKYIFICKHHSCSRALVLKNRIEKKNQNNKKSNQNPNNKTPKPQHKHTQKKEKENFEQNWTANTPVLENHSA